MSLQQLKNAGKMARKSCQLQTGPTTEQLDNLQRGIFSDKPDEKVKCYVKCIQTMVELMTEDRYDADKALKQIPKVIPPAFRDKARDGINKCRHSGDPFPDSCDASYAVIECAYEQAPDLFYFP